MNSRALFLFTSATIVSAAVSTAVQAHATTNFRAYHATSCELADAPVTQVIGVNNVGQVYDKNNNGLTLACPLINDSFMPLQSPPTSETVTVRGFANGFSASANVLAQACRTFGTSGGAGGACDAGATTEIQGIFALHPSTSQWTNGSSTDYYYINVVTGNTFSGSHNVIFGYDVVQN